jgi:hypothetical protein
MPIPNTPKPTYPNVPMAPGIPLVPRQPGSSSGLASIVLLASDAAAVVSLFAGPQWGLFTQDGTPAFSAIPGVGGIAGGIVASAIRLVGGGGQSIGSEEFRLDHKIATAPQEQGAFLSYNKVSTPFAGRVTYVLSGVATLRGAFLASVKAMQASLTLLSLVMPEYTYPSCTVVHHDLKRSARDGVSMFSVDIWVEEVRITGTAAFSNTQTPAGAAQTNGGTVQPQIPTPPQSPLPAALT